MDMLMNDVDGKPITLSPSSLKDAQSNPHLFWIEKRKRIAWPRGVFPSLPGGMDRTLKPWYDGWRAKGELPPEIRNSGIEGCLHPDQAMIDKWRSRGKGGMLSTIITAEVDGKEYGLTFQGMIDDAIKEKDGSLTVLDYKTRGSAPKPGDTEIYYGSQADGYALLFSRNKARPSGKGHFCYYWPVDARPNAAFDERGDTNYMLDFGFESRVVHVEVDADRCLQVIKGLIRVLAGPIPPADDSERGEFLAKYSASMKEAA